MSLEDLTETPLPTLPPREPASHKGDFGRVLVIGGSSGMAGAPALAALAALRSGAGLVSLAVPRAVQSTVASFEASYMVHGLGSTDDETLNTGHRETILMLAEKMTTFALGPGIGTGDATVELVQQLYAELEAPLVVDADGLNALANSPSILEQPAGPRILTPHPGEFKRLAGKSAGDDLEARKHNCSELAQRDSTGQTVVVLKGHQTVVSDGRRVAINSTGNPGLATGGTGDCLTGVITGLVAQNLEPFDAARLGVYLHGLAGDLAANELGQISLIASDLLDYLPGAFQARI